MGKKKWNKPIERMEDNCWEEDWGTPQKRWKKYRTSSSAERRPKEKLVKYNG